MKKITIAFDIDGTLIKNNLGESTIIGNSRVIELLKILFTFKNIKIIVWSGRGKEWAIKTCKTLCIDEYVSGYASKNHEGKDERGKHIFSPEIKPDICIDDIHSCDLGKINLIVREK